jgi:hypothetical protein
MDLDGLLSHYFGTDDPGTLSEAAFATGLERLSIAFGVEQEPSRKFALWTLMDALGVAPLPAEAFRKEPRLRAAADAYLTAAYRLERSGEGDD